MHLRVKIYTTTNSQFFKEELPFVRSCILKARGIEDVSFAVESVRAPQSPMTIRDREGVVRLVWDWFRKTFHHEDTFNAVGFHFTPHYRSIWGLTESINGSYYINSSDDTLDFVFCCDRSQSERYPFSEATRLILHEIRHGLCHWTGKADDTHLWDYQLNAIHESFASISVRRWSILKRIATLLDNFVSKWSGSY